MKFENKKIRLIILDLYGTLVRTDVADNTPRKGLVDFLKRNKREGKKIVLFTDDNEESAREVLNEARILNYFDKLYSRKDLDEDGCKNLLKVCYDFNASKYSTVFIGDNGFGRDAASSKKYRIALKKVPQYRAKDKFSFKRIVF